MIRFQDLTVADVMTPDPVCLPADATLGEAERLFLDTGLEEAPVTDDEGRYLGSCGLRHLLAVRCASGASPRTVGGLELRPGPICDAEIRLAQACQHMIRERAHRLIVLDDQERPIGVVSSVEAARVFACVEDMSNARRRGPRASSAPQTA